MWNNHGEISSKYQVQFRFKPGSNQFFKVTSLLNLNLNLNLNWTSTALSAAEFRTCSKQRHYHEYPICVLGSHLMSHGCSWTMSKKGPEVCIEPAFEQQTVSHDLGILSHGEQQPPLMKLSLCDLWSNCNMGEGHGIWTLSLVKHVAQMTMQSPWL